MNATKDLEEIFTTVYHENSWGDDSSVSGPGSSLEQTIVIRENIITLIKAYRIKTIVDAPCGDFFWMKELLKNIINDIDLYTGIDIVENLIVENKKKYESKNISFSKLNLTREIVPQADLIICRDCFLHLSYRNIFYILNNFKKSGADYLLVSTYYRHKNKNVYNYFVDGRAINLERYPFKISNKLEIINENYHGQNEEYNDKSLILIKLNSVKINNIYIRILINELFFIPSFLSLSLLRKVYRGIILLSKRIL